MSYEGKTFLKKLREADGLNILRTKYFKKLLCLHKIVGLEDAYSNRTEEVHRAWLLMIIYIVATIMCIHFYYKYLSVKQVLHFHKFFAQPKAWSYCYKNGRNTQATQYRAFGLLSHLHAFLQLQIFECIIILPVLKYETVVAAQHIVQLLY